jgi:hypothetical protein
MQASHFLLMHDIGALPPHGAANCTIWVDGFDGIATAQPSARLSVDVPLGVAEALVGRVFCKVDAQHFPIDVGGLLTTSQTPGRVMEEIEPVRAFGDVIGKALNRRGIGLGLVFILITSVVAAVLQKLAPPLRKAL